MQTTRMIIAQHAFHIPQGPPLETLKTDLTHAVQEGGGMVSFVADGHHQITVLISPGLSVLFENDPNPENSNEPVDTNTDNDVYSFDDFDY